MKIGLQTWGSDGDIRPFCALAGGLAAAGHEVTLAVTSIDHKDYSDLASSLGFAIRHIAGERPLNEESLKNIILGVERSGDIVRQMRILCDVTFDPVLDLLDAAACDLARENDVLVGHIILHPLASAAQRSDKPFIALAPAPVHLPSSLRPPSGFPNLGGWSNRLLWSAASLTLDYLFRKKANGLRKVHGQPPVKRVMNELWTSPLLNIVAASAHLVDPPADWDETVRVTGFLDVPTISEGWSMPEDLRAFLDAGEPPLYLTFGSFNLIDLEKNARLLCEAARLSGRRAIVQSIWEEVNYRPNIESIYLIGKTPHHEIFPHCRAVVHHGGAGTTHSTLFCGKPAVVVAHGFDQPYWAERLYRQGVAAKPLVKRRVTPEKIAAAINQVAGDVTMIDRAKTMGEKVRAEEGVASAVAKIEESLAPIIR